MTNTTYGHHPAWTVALFVVAAVALMGAPAWGFFVKDPDKERRVYWWAWVIGGLLLAAALSDRGVKAPLAALLATAVAAVALAYFKTSFLTVRGRVYALNPNRRRPASPQPSELEP